MKKTQIIELLKNFKKTFVTFFSIVLFVSFGMAAYLGLDWSRKSIADSIGNYFEDGNLQEFEFSYGPGLNNSDISYLKDMPEIYETEGRYETFRFWKSDDIKKQIHIYSITERINRITKLDGEMPRGEDEILVESAFAKNNGIKIGDKIDFSKSDTEAALLKNNSFKVSGIVKTAEYTSVYSDTYGVNPTSGCAIKGIMYVDTEAFRKEALPGFTSVLLKCGELEDEPMFTDNYNKKANEISDHLHEKLEERFQKEYISLTSKSTNPSYISAKSISDIFARLRIPLAGLFVIVGALVCFFAVARNVFDQSKFVGVKKALGFYRREITVSFLLFSFLSTLIGVILGTLLARYGIESVLDQAIQEQYPFNETLYVFNMKEVMMFALFEIIIIVAVTYFASISILKKDANTLLSGSGRKPFREKKYMKMRIFRNMSALGQTILNNIIGERRRALSTIVGVMGITALIVSSFSLNNFIQGAFDKQNAEITKYDTVLYVEQNNQEVKMIESELESKDLCYCGIMSTYVTITTPDDQNLSTSIYVVDDDTTLKKLFDLHDGKNSIEKIDGLYSSVSYREEYKEKADEQMVLTDTLGQKHKIKPAGYFDYYLVQNQLIIDRETYEKEFDDVFAVNTIILDRGDYTIESLNKDLVDYSGYINAEDFYKLSKESFDGFAAVFKLVLGVYIVLAILMALIVIMNLLDMFIKEKKYELIVMMINGFHTRTVRAYIYVDTIIMCSIGTVLGLILGVLMGNASLDAYRTASIYFEGGINVQAVIIGVVLTVLLVFIVTLFSIKKIDKFKLGDINA